MAFPRSQRFVERGSCAPPPTAYYIPSASEENSCSVWVRPCSFDHNCHQCLPYNKSHDHSTQSNKSNEGAHVPQCTKQHTCASLLNTKENACCLQKKEGSSNSKFKKNTNLKLTEPKAPSFMTRPRHSVHNCFANITTEVPNQTTSFNRQSIKRKSIKIVRGNKEKSSEDTDNALSPCQVLIKPNAKDNKEFNVSYVIRSEDGDLNIDGKGEGSKTCDVAASNVGAIPKKLNKLTDDMKEQEHFEILDSSSTEDNTLCFNTHPNVNLEHSDLVEKDVLEKDNSLQNQFLKELDETKISRNEISFIDEEASTSNILSWEKLAEETAKKLKKEIENAMNVKNGTEENILKCCDLPSDTDDHVVLLVTNEFIDDEYDSYIKNVTLETLHTMGDSDLFKICKTLIHKYMKKPNVKVPRRKRVNAVKKVVIKRAKKSAVDKQIEKLLEKKKDCANNADIWSLMEQVIRSAITDLKGEFKQEIYKKTEQKVDTLMTKLAKVLLKAEESIESRCERTAVGLISKLQKIVN